MSEQHFEVIFRGDVDLGRSVVEVKEGLARLFDTEPSRIDQMFSGKPVVIKANLDEDTALHYQASLKKVGALVDIRSTTPVDSSASISAASSAENTSTDATPDQVETQPDTDTQQDSLGDAEEMVDFDFDVAPIGADVLPSKHKKDYTPVDVDTSHLSVSDVGADVLEDKDKRSYEENDVDTSHLSIDDQEDTE